MGFFKELSDKLSQDIKDLDTDDNTGLEETALFEDSSTPDEGTGESYVSKLRDERREGYNSYDDSYATSSQNVVKEEINNIINSLEKMNEEEIMSTEDISEVTEKEEEPVTEEVSVEEKEVITTAEVVKQEIQVKKEEKEKIVGTVITKNTIIAGNIATVDDMEIYGAVRGDVECKGSLAIFGEVAGNAVAANICINTAKFEGDLTSEGCVEVGSGTVVIGNITAESSLISGAVKGEIDVCGPVILESTAIVKGNIKAKTVKIDNGAVLQGFCELSHSDLDIDNFFEPELPKLEVQKKMEKGSDDGDLIENTSSNNDDTKNIQENDNVVSEVSEILITENEASDIASNYESVEENNFSMEQQQEMVEESFEDESIIEKQQEDYPVEEEKESFQEDYPVEEEQESFQEDYPVEEKQESFQEDYPVEEEQESFQEDYTTEEEQESFQEDYTTEEEQESFQENYTIGEQQETTAQNYENDVTYDFVLNNQNGEAYEDEFAQPDFEDEVQKDMVDEEDENINYEVGELLNDNFNENIDEDFDDMGFVIEDNEIINENLYKGNKLSEL